MFTVQIVDDEPIVRLGLRKLIDWEELGFEVVCEAENGEEALLQLEDNHIDVIITDIEMPIMDGIAFMGNLREREYRSEILVLTAYSEFEYAKEAIKYGVVGYILKPIEEEEIVASLEDVKKRLLKNLEVEGTHTLDLDMTKERRVFSRKKEKQLIKYIMTTDQRAFEILEEILEEEYSYGEKTTMSMCVRFSYILEEVVGTIKEKFSYLSKLEHVEHYLDFGQGENTPKEALINAFEENVSSLITIFKESKVMYKDNLIMQACQYIIENIDEDISLTTVSDRLGMSKNYLSSLFKQETGESFLVFVTRMKMKRAQLLLKEKNLMVYEVCYMLGYRDTTYFTRLFKKYTNMTPSEYKKAVYDEYEKF